jgi:cis-3-alkyl-4-acyloxetan-2-one decarboxylase
MQPSILVGNTPVFIEGSGPRTIVMLHGWPDTHALWRKQIAFFRADYVCVSFTMPGFSRDDRTDYSLVEVVRKISDIVDAVSPREKVILLAHDWGCVFGYEYAMRHSDRVERMIGLDVGDASSQEFTHSLSVAQKLMVFTYQFILAISFLCPRVIGNAMARNMASALNAKSIRENIHAGMSMPYAMRWLRANGGFTDMLPVEPEFPFYYGFATGKPMMFHSPEWIGRIAQGPGNKVRSFDCGHWLMIDQADEFNADAARWLAG